MDAADERGARYREAICDAEDWEYLRVLADLPTASLDHFCLLHKGACELLATIDDDVVDDRVEASGLINLWAIAAAIAENAQKPLFTLVVPSRFK